MRLGTEQVFTEKDITYYDLDFIIVPTCFCSLNICGWSDLHISIAAFGGQEGEGQVGKSLCCQEAKKGSE